MKFVVNEPQNKNAQLLLDELSKKSGRGALLVVCVSPNDMF
jgi:hypothetical protein